MKAPSGLRLLQKSWDSCRQSLAGQLSLLHVSFLPSWDQPASLGTFFSWQRQRNKSNMFNRASAFISLYLHRTCECSFDPSKSEDQTQRESRGGKIYALPLGGRSSKSHDKGVARGRDEELRLNLFDSYTLGRLSLYLSACSPLPPPPGEFCRGHLAVISFVTFVNYILTCLFFFGLSYFFSFRQQTTYFYNIKQIQ